MQATQKAQVVQGQGEDPFLLEILKSAFETIADNLAVTIMRSAYSEIVRESLDFSTALCDWKGRTVAQGVCTPLHLGAFQDSMSHLIEHTRADVSPGDIFIFNDPFMASGQHLPDIYIVKPIFYDGEIEGWATTLAHQSDVGGIVPGSNALGASEIFQEGLRLPFLKFYSKGVRNDTLVQMICANVRTPHLVMGDLEAQIAACHNAEREYIELLERYGSDTVRRCSDTLQDYAEALTRQELCAIPDGVYSFVDHIDGLGRDPQPVEFRVQVRIAGDEAFVSWDGTSPQVTGGINCTFSFTKSCVYAALRSVFQSDVPNCEGFSRPIHVTAPEGSVINPKFPAPVGARGITGYRIIDAMFGALADAVPGRVAADGSGGSTLPTLFGWHAGKRFVFCETLMGTTGAGAESDGQEGIPHIGANQANVPVELIELNYPIRIEYYGFVADTGGPGKFRGGLALRREYRILCEVASLNMRSDKLMHPPHGLFGGAAGAAPVIEIHRADERIPVPLLPLEPLGLKAGDLVVVQMPGGGGYGPPSERDPRRIEADILEGRITEQHARIAYGRDVVATAA